MKPNVKIQSFRKALSHFLELCDDTLELENVVEMFSQLKKNGFIEHIDEMQYWRGNHDRGQQTIKLYLVDEPLRFYVVESSYWESLDYEQTTVKRWVYVPEE